MLALLLFLSPAPSPDATLAAPAVAATDGLSYELWSLCDEEARVAERKGDTPMRDRWRARIAAMVAGGSLVRLPAKTTLRVLSRDASARPPSAEVRVIGGRTLWVDAAALR
jgi:uncharacterized membrane protein YcjF (UPF0283 family)